MKILLTLVYFLVSVCSFSQKGNADILHFSVVCGFGAQTSEEILAFHKLNNLKEYSMIRKMLLEGTDIEKVLSTIILKEHYLNNRVELTSIELDKINQIAKSNRRFSLCFTCTLQEDGTLKQLFTKKRLLPIYEIIKESLFSSL